MKKTAKEFWTSRKKYPSFGSKHRRYYETMWLIPKLKGTKSILEIGCGSGEFLDIVIRMTDVEKVYGCDVSENLLVQLDKRVNAFYYDIYEGGLLPEVDSIILWGVIQYVFDDKVLSYFLKTLPCKKLYMRTPCDSKEVVIDKYSQDLGANYSSRYMTLDQVIKLLSQSYTIQSVSRAYPDEIESKYGSKQWLIECEKK